ncbi:MAG: hypothetical protein WB799_11110 [Candidatus Sulfotelmatobacter sp.]
MKPGQLKFGGGVAQTILHPAVLIVILIAGILTCVLPRRKAVVPFLLAAILTPMDQVLLIGSLHFFMLRVLVLFGIIRILKDTLWSKRALFSGGMNKIDVAVILLTVFTALNGILLFQASGAVINQMGNLYTVFGVYFLLRFLIRDEEDMVRTIQTMACIAAIVAVVMTYEVATGHNPYAMLGGARVADYASLAVRDDRFRARGPFGHSILAGTFGAVLLPLFVALWWKARKHRMIAVMGIISATVITVACNSSTPVLGYAAGVLALCLWPLRQWMRAMRWAILLTLVCLQLVLKNPVWHLITRIDIIGGSSSWHRFMLVDQCIRHFGDWWLLGVKDTSGWGWEMWDTANQYVSVCANSGLLPFILLLGILIYGFKYLGRARRAAGKDRKRALFVWGLGSALFANVVAFFGISYFDQTMVAWYGLLAMIPAAMAVRPKKELNRTAPRVPSHAADMLAQLKEPAGLGTRELENVYQGLGD